MILIRRYLLLMSLMFWQGGFTFYSAVVVPIGSDLLGSGRDQGFITRSVTNYLNLAGVAALALSGLGARGGARDVSTRASAPLVALGCLRDSRKPC